MSWSVLTVSSSIYAGDVAHLAMNTASAGFTSLYTPCCFHTFFYTFLVVFSFGFTTFPAAINPGLIMGISLAFVFEGDSETHFQAMTISCLIASSSPIDVCHFYMSHFLDLDVCLFFFFVLLTVFRFSGFCFLMLSFKFLWASGFDVFGLCSLIFSFWI